MNPDGISYLDIAREALSKGPLALVNRYWSPLYPALIAFWERIHRPSPFQEFAYVHALNAVIYTIAAITFAYFLRELIRFRFSEGRTGRVVFVAFGFALFFRFMNKDMNSFVLTPDLLVAADAFLSAGLFFRILRRREAGWLTFAALGAVLAVGYLAKAVMLPAGLALLCILWLRSPCSRSHRTGVLTAAGVMFLLSAPQILLVSKLVGHLSFSETGRLNYIWYVDGRLQQQGWTGTPGGEEPAHGPRVIGENPKLIEFAAPIPGTYPLWYDPGYWYAGAKVRINIKGQIQAIKNSLRFYDIIFADLRLPLEGLVVLLILAYAARSRIGRTELLFLLWPIVVLSMYALVLTDYRYVAPFLVIFWMAAYSAAVMRLGQVERTLLTLLIVVMFFSSVRETFSTYRKIILPGPANSSYIHTVWMNVPPEPSPDQIAAKELKAMGENPGDAIATVGAAFNNYYAHIARLHVIAEAVDAEEFWSLGPAAAVTAEQKLASTGAKALVARNRPKKFQVGLWEDLPGTQYSVLRLRE